MGRDRDQYEVRVRIQIGPNKWVKKSRFYEANDKNDAASKYDGPGNIMWCRKKSKERFWGVGEFFKLGDSLLRELGSNDDGEKGGTLLEQVQREKEKVRKKRYLNTRIKIKSNRGY